MRKNRISYDLNLIKIVFCLSLCVVIAGLLTLRRGPSLPSFVIKKSPTSSAIPILIKNNIPTIKDAPSVHSASVTGLDDGRLLSVWFAGSGEGRSDVEIYGSFYDISSNLWSKPKSFLDRKRVGQDSHQFIKKLGNPVIYRSSNGDIHLFVVGVSFGGWATSKIYHYISKDRAQSFAYKGLLELGALMNLSFLVRSSPIELEDGGFYLPIYHELATKYPLIVRFDREGNMLYSQKLTSHSGILQPSITALDSKTCLAVFRNYVKRGEKAMMMQKCEDGGKTWSEIKESNLSNDNSSVAIFRIADSIYLLHNTRENIPTESRGTLVLSKFNQDKWEKVVILDTAQGERREGKSVEVSYPNVYVNGDIVDIVYTNNRTHISHIRLNQKWILDQANKDEE